MSITRPSAPETHLNLVKIARKQLKNRPKDKYRVDVYLNGRKRFELLSWNKDRLHKSMKRVSSRYVEDVTFGEIKGI